MIPLHTIPQENPRPLELHQRIIIGLRHYRTEWNNFRVDSRGELYLWEENRWTHMHGQSAIYWGNKAGHLRWEEYMSDVTIIHSESTEAPNVLVR